MVSQFDPPIAGGRNQHVRHVVHALMERGLLPGSSCDTGALGIVPWMKVSKRMGGAIHEDHERWCAPRSGPTTLDFPMASELSRIPLVSTVPLDASPQAIATALCYGRKRKAPPNPSLLSSWDDCVDQLLATYEGSLLCAS